MPQVLTISCKLKVSADRCVNPACHWEGDADFNSANVIALLGLHVNQPHAKRGASHEVRGWLANCKATIRVSGA